VESGEAVVLVVTREHHDLIRQRLLFLPEHVSKAEGSGQLTVMDAEQLLSMFMLRDMPNAELFQSYVGGLLDSKLALFPVLRVYGEMVQVLWSAGKGRATVALEQLWNKLVLSRGVTLLCGYSIARFARHQQSDDFRAICEEHTHVFPAESYEALPDDASRARFVAQLQQQAVALQTELVQRQLAEQTLLRRDEELHEARDHLHKAQHELRRLRERESTTTPRSSTQSGSSLGS
jgi:hypothetical protein